MQPFQGQEPGTWAEWPSCTGSLDQQWSGPLWAESLNYGLLGHDNDKDWLWRHFRDEDKFWRNNTGEDGLWGYSTGEDELKKHSRGKNGL